MQKNSAVAGALTGVALAPTADDKSHEQIVQCAITGAAISTAANLLTGIFLVEIYKRLLVSRVIKPWLPFFNRVRDVLLQS